MAFDRSSTGFDHENYNRVFVLGGKGCTPDELKEAFHPFGDVKDVYIVRDKVTHESKGISYITFAKASEAALAIEEMNGKHIASHPKPLKVILANSRVEGSVREPQEEDKMRRLFIVVSKSLKEKDIEDEFKKYGDLEYVRVLTDRNTGSSRGLAYVKFVRAYHAAIALETCESHFRAVFASTKSNNQSSGNGQNHRRPIEDYSAGDYAHRGSTRSHDLPSSRNESRSLGYSAGGVGGYGALSPAPMSSAYGKSGYREPMSHGDEIDQLRMYPNTGEVVLDAFVMNTVTKDQVTRLFDLIPGLVYCQYDNASGRASVKYTMPQLAAFARDRLDGFEFPTGSRLSVKLSYERTGYSSTRYDRDGGDRVSNSIAAMRQSMGSVQGPEGLAALMQTIQAATAILQHVGLGGGAGGGSGAGDGVEGFVNVALPKRQPTLSRETPVVERLFIVSSPDTFPDSVLEDIFCRFGNLISAFFMRNKKFGYIKYADAVSAARAIDTMNNAVVYGNRLKVLTADPPRTDGVHDGEGGERAGSREKRSHGNDDDHGSYRGKYSRHE